MAMKPKTAGAKARSKPKAGTRASEEELLDDVDTAVDQVDTAVEDLDALADELDAIEDAADADAAQANLAAAVETLTQTVAALNDVATDVEEVGVLESGGQIRVQPGQNFPHPVVAIGYRVTLDCKIMSLTSAASHRSTAIKGCGCRTKRSCGLAAGTRSSPHGSPRS